MPLSKEEIPNFPLNGYELGLYTLELLASVMRQHDVMSAHSMQQMYESLQIAFANDFHFNAMYTYPQVGIELAVQFHSIEEKWGFTITPEFHQLNPAAPEFKPFVRRPVGVPAPPLDGWMPEAQHIIDCFTISTKVTNPNLVRVHCNMPVVIRQKVPPVFGQVFPTFEDHQVKYDPTDYPPLPPPEVTDQTAHFAKQWGITKYDSAAVLGGLLGDTLADLAAIPSMLPIETPSTVDGGTSISEALIYPKPEALSDEELDALTKPEQPPVVIGPKKKDRRAR